MPPWKLQELQLLPTFLEQATEGSPAVQRPASACVAALCSDPGLVLAALPKGPAGLGAVVRMAASEDSEVQRQAAAALWHLAVHPEGRRRVVAAGALAALLAMARSRRNVRARELAQQALRQCYEDPATLSRLQEEAAAAGLDAAQLAAFTSGAGNSGGGSGGGASGLARLGSLQLSESYHPSSAASGSPCAGDRTGELSPHRRQASDPASIPDTDELSAISRSPSAATDGFSFSTPAGPTAIVVGNGRLGPAPQPARLELPEEGKGGSPLPIPIISPVTAPLKRASPRAHPLPPSPSSSFKK